MSDWWALEEQMPRAFATILLWFCLAPVIATTQSSDDADVREAMAAFLRAFMNLDWVTFRESWVDRPVMFVPPGGAFALTDPSPVDQLSRIDDPASIRAVLENRVRGYSKKFEGYPGAIPHDFSSRSTHRRDRR
jgi:hypothetical protein